MALTKEKKIKILSKLKDIFSDAKSVVFVKFNGLAVSDTSNMRSVLRNEDVGYFVAKKTLIKRTLGETNIKGDIPNLLGEIAIAYSNDPTSPARNIYEFAKKFKENIVIAGGVFEGRYMNEAEMTEIASIPPLQTLYGMFVNVINSPIQRCAIVLYKIAQSKA